MVNAPLRIPLVIPQTRKPSDLFKAQAIAADALKIEHYVNSRMHKEYIREFDFSALAADLSIDQDRVRTLLSKLACNENTIAICNSQQKPKAPGSQKVVSSAGSLGLLDTPPLVATTDGRDWI